MPKYKSFADAVDSMGLSKSSANNSSERASKTDSPFAAAQKRIGIYTPTSEEDTFETYKRLADQSAGISDFLNQENPYSWQDRSNYQDMITGANNQLSRLSGYLDQDALDEAMAFYKDAGGVLSNNAQYWQEQNAAAAEEPFQLRMSKQKALQQWQEYQGAHEAMESSGLGSEGWYAKNKADYDALIKEYNETTKAIQAAQAQAQSGTYAGEFAFMFEDERKAGEQKVAELTAKAEELARQISAAQGSMSYANAFRFEDVLNQDDFEEKAAAGLADLEERREASRAAQALDITNNDWIAALRDETVTDELPTDDWTDEQKKIYGYLRERDKQNGTSEASDYGRSINSRLNTESRNAQIKDVTDDGGWAMAGRSAVARGANLFSGADYLANVAEQRAKGYVMPKSYMSLTDYGRAVDSEITQRLNDTSGTIGKNVPVLGGKGLGDAYGILTSAIDSGLAIAVGGEVGSLAMMGTRSASNAFLDAKERGATDGQALNYGLASGVAEVIFEKFSVENLLSKNVSKNFIKRFAKQGAIEMSEEMATSFANAISESVILKDKGELNDAIMKNMAQGMSYEEAEKRALIDTAQGILYDGLAGFISGGLMVGGQTIMAGGNANVARQVEDYERQQQWDEAMRDAGIGSVENQTASALDVLEGRVTPEQQQEREQRGRDKLDELQRENNEKAAENRREVVSAILERTAEAQGTELSEGDRSALAGLYDYEQNGSNGRGFAQAAIEAFELGKSGNVTAAEARMSSRNAAKLTADQFDLAFNLGAGTESAQAEAADVSTEEGKTTLTAALAALGTHAEAAAEVYDASQNVNEYAAAMSLATGYAANGGDVAALVQQTKASEDGNQLLATLTDAQITKAQEIGRQMQQERAAKIERLTARRAEISAQAEAILEKEVPELGEINATIKDITDYRNQEKAELSQMREEMDALLEADPDAAETEAFQRAQQRARQLEEAIENDGKILQQMREARNEAKSKAQRKKGTVSFDGATIDGKHYDGVDRSKLNKVQRSVVDMVEALADIINLDYVFFTGPAGMGGAYPGNGVVYININSGMGVRAFSKEIAGASLSHELTHFAQEYAPEEYEALRKFVVETVMKKSPAQFDKMVRQQMAWESGISYDAAVDELVANGCMTMLQNTQAVRQLVREHLTLAERFADRIEEIGQKIKDAFSAVDVNDKAGIYHVARFLQEEYAEIQKRWDDAITAATRNYNAEKTVERATGAKENAAENGDVQNMAWDRKDINRAFIDFNNVDARDRAQTSKKQSLINRGKVVAVSQKVIDKLPGDTDWSDIKKAREAIKEILREKLGSESVAFSFDGGILTAYMTSDGRNHSAGGNASEERAAMFSMVKDLIDNAEYIYSAKHDVHGMKGLALPANTEWDSFEAVADINEKYVPIIFSVYTNDLDVRSKIYSVFADEKGAVSHGTGQQNLVGQPNYGATTPKQSIADTSAKSKSKNEQNQTWDDIPSDQQVKIATSMSMQQAGDMVQRAFNSADIREWFEGEYRTGLEWLKGEGADAVALVIENEYSLQQKYLDKIPAYLNEEISLEDILNAYVAGKLTGGVSKAKTTRIDTKQSTGYRDARFYAPQQYSAEEAIQLYDLANQKATKANKADVMNARKKILFLAHDYNASELLGISQAELNKKLRSWSNYPASGLDISRRINSGIPAENRWTGIQNCSIINRQTITDEDILGLVKEVKGTSTDYQRQYIARTMLALDTHIDWSRLSFEFKAGKLSGNARGLYSGNHIVIGGNGYANTVAHEMGHALDEIWGRDILESDQKITESVRTPDKITDAEARQFYINFRAFIDSITDSADIRSSYTQKNTETFARFIAKFVEFADNAAGNKFYNETSYYSDRFTSSQFIEFARLLQEKATLDAKRATNGQTQFQRWDDTSDDTAAERAGREMAYSRLQAENAILTETVEAMRKLTSKQDKTIAALQKRLQITKSPETRTSDARKLARTLIQENNSKTDVDALTEQIKALGDYILQTETSQLSEDEIKNRARSIAREVIETATEQVGIEQDTARQIGEDIRGRKLSIDEAFLGELDGAGGYDAFRKSLFGRLTLAKREANTREGREGYTTVDRFYNDMQSTYGEAYFPNAANEGEQVQILAQLLASSAPMEVNPYTQYMGEVTEDLANRIVMDAMNGVLRPTAPTTMDKQKARAKALQERIKELQAEDKMQQREAASLYRTIYDLSVALDKAESRYETLSKGSAHRISQVQAEGRARTIEARAQERAKAAENIQALREHYQDMAKRARQGRQNTASRNKIRKLINDLNARLARPSENRYVPRELVQLTIDTLDMIDLDTGRSTKVAEKLADIRAMYERYKNDPDSKYAVVYDEVTAEMLSNLEMEIRGTKLGDMNEQQLNAVYEALKSLNHVISKAVNVKIGEEEHNAFTLAKEMSTETRDIPKVQTSWVKNKWLVSHLRADVMFKRFGGFKKNSTWSMIGRMLNDGQLKQTGIQMDLSRPFAGLINSRKGMEDFTGTNYFGKIQQDKLVDIGLKDADGNAILVTHDIMVGIYMDLQNEENRRHFIRGGKEIPDLQEFYDGKGGFNGKGKTAVGIAAQLSDLMDDLAEAKRGQYGEWAEQLQDQIDELLAEGETNADSVQASIEKQLTEFDREWIKATQQLMDQDSKRYLNETTMEVYGIEKARVDNYFPITVDPDFLNASFDSVSRNMSLENVGFLKERVQSGKPTLALGTFSVANKQIERVAQYCGLMPAIRNFQKILNKSDFGYQDSLKKALRSKFGTEAMKYLDGLIADLSGARGVEKDTMGLVQLLGKLRGNLAQTTLTLNFRVALAQAASYPTAAAELDAKSLTKAFFRGGRNNMMISRADQELIQKWSPLLWLRMQGYSTQELGDIKRNNSAMAKLWKKLRWATGWIQAVDGATIGRLWYATEYWVQDHMPDLEKGSDAYYEAVAKKFNDVVEKTQPNYTTMQRATILRDPSSIWKTLTMFMTQRLQNFNIVYDATASYQKARADFANSRNGVTKADVTEARATMIRSVCSQLAQAALYVGFKFLADALLHNMKKYRDKDTGDMTAESVSAQLLNGYIDAMMGSIMFGSEMYGIVKAMAGIEKWYGISLSGVDSVNDFVESIVNLANAKVDWDDEKSKKAFYKRVMSLATSFAQTQGLPLNNGIKIGQAIYQHIEDGVNGEFLSFEAGYERTSKQNRMKDLAVVGITPKQYDQAVKEADEDGNGSIKQDEIGAWLNKALDEGKITKEQADALWTAAGPSWTKTYDVWAGNAKPAKEQEEEPEVKETAEEPKEEKPKLQPITVREPEKAEVSDYESFRKNAPIYSDKKKNAYSQWQENVEPLGISLSEYTDYLIQSDADGNGSVKQDELGVVLVDAVYIGDLTMEQASAIWKTLWKGTGRSKSFEKWLSQNQ